MKRGCHIQIALGTRCGTTTHTAAVCRQAGRQAVVEGGGGSAVGEGVVEGAGVRQDADEALTQSRFDRNSIQAFYV